jgi:hypothetical protein
MFCGHVHSTGSLIKHSQHWLASEEAQKGKSLLLSDREDFRPIVYVGEVHCWVRNFCT